MNADKVLLTTSIYPFPTLPNDTSLTDATGARFSRADGIFCIISHSHSFATHLLAQNITAPAVVLEYPRWNDFTAEIAKGYSVLCISALPVHLDGVLRMCRYVREHSPQTKIILGGYAGMALGAVEDEKDWKQYADDICHGEGVRYMRRMFGLDVNAPVRQKLMPKGGGSPPFITRFPKGAIGFIVSGLGCPGMCDFCSNTALYDHTRITMLSPEDLVRGMVQYHQNFPHVSSIFVVDEDHFRWPDYLSQIREPWQSYPELSEAVDWFSFGSLDFIGAFVDRFGWDAIPEMGIGVMFIGVESKFGDLLKYKKRSAVDPKWVFKNLHRMGVRTVGSWVCGWDFHSHANVMEDLNYFVALCPTYQQLTRLSPFPGTPLYDRLRKEGRLHDVPWENMHFWSETQKNLGLEDHETLNIVEQGYELLYRTWGPSLLRRMNVELNGYEYCQRSSNAVLREHRTKFFKKQCGMVWTLLGAMEKYSPNGIVRRQVRMADKRYRAVIGEPTPVMALMSDLVVGLAGKEYAKTIFNPSFYRAKEEPFKRYVYDRTNDDAPVPYTTEWPGGRTFKVRKAMAVEAMRYFALEKALKAKRAATRGRSDPLIDDYLIGMVSDRAFGFGL